jgi:hypothetical protein
MSVPFSDGREPVRLTFGDILLLTAFGHIDTEGLAAYCVEFPMFDKWLRRECKRARDLAETLKAKGHER